MSVLDAKGQPVQSMGPIDLAALDAVECKIARMGDAIEADLAEGLYGVDPEARVYELRRSVLGDASGPAPLTTHGLAEWLPERPTGGVVEAPFFGVDRDPPRVKPIP